jgi:type IV pilus assembly protein PilO
MRFGLREFIFFLVLLAVPVASYFYVFKPRNQEISRANEEISTKQSRLDTLAAVAATIEDIGLEIERGRESVLMIEAKLPTAQDVEGILEQVWQIARRNALNLVSVKSEKPVPAALYMEQPLKVVMEGQFDGFYQFMLELENLPRITRVHQMKIEKVGAKGGPKDESLPPGSMKAEFILSIYFEPQNVAGQTTSTASAAGR